ncbi:EAL domain-containing protein [Denitromonas iodatirespirans]|uniref:EAL domain-containing protein n=1 Tax=Denitromonas iodatirespirans TaxID=2795389 RepID=A0A944DB29_DENI1|nr:EAL domain-containing protein [Denitromonas iodatirespirans]MBT0961288.1 EAL domain-containing protein [Denitromonas iodatirespirans]
MLHRLAAFVVAVLMLAAPTVRAAELVLTDAERAWLAQHPVIRVGFDPNFAPYSFTDAEGRFQGVAAGFTRRVEDALGVRFERVADRDWPTLFKAFKAREVDVIAALAYHPERTAFTIFSEMYLPTPLVIFTQQGAPQLTSIDQLAAQRVALVKGYAASQKVVERFPSLSPTYVDTSLAGLQALALGKVDAYAGVLGTGTYLASANGITNLKVNAAFAMENHGQHFGVRKDWPQLAQLIDRALLSIDAQEREAILRDWVPVGVGDLVALDYAPQLRRYLTWFLIGGGGILLVALAMLWANRQLHREIKRREAAWAESEVRFRATFELAAVGIAHVAPDGRWIRVNPRLCDILGYPPAVLLTKTFHDITHPDDLDADLRRVRRTLAGEIPGYTIEKRYFHQDGRVVWAQLTVSLVRRPDGAPDYFISVLEDVSERHAAAEASRQATAVFESTREGIIVTDLDQRILTVNPAFTEITGYSADEVIGQMPTLLHSGLHGDAFYQSLWATLVEAGHWQGEVMSRRKSGEVFPELLTISTVRDITGQPSRYVAVLTDLSRLRAFEAELAHLAHYDPLTGLPNRLLVQSRLDHALEKAQREGCWLAVMFIDLDRFKDVNDSLGHPVGDELLVAVAQRMRSRLRESDTLARLGGDEFLVVLEDIHRPEDAAEVAQALVRLQEASVSLPSGHEVYVGLSIGISLYPTDGNGTTELIRQADAAMYQAKGQGRNTFRFYTAALTEAADQRLAMEGRLRRALNAGEFVLHFQPQFEASTGEVVGCEALVRWQDADGRLMPPDRFIPLAEDTGLIVPLGQWVLETACAQAKAWRDAGVADLVMAVNLSARQLHQRDLAQRVAEVLERTGLPPDRLKLELTESMIMGQGEEAEALLQSLKALGVSLSIDDFGTGYSSLAYLKRFPIDEMKIDRSFVRDTPDDASDSEIVATIVAMARNLKLRVVAEGVETERQLAFLVRLGCNACQGYLVSPALPAAAFERFIAHRTASTPAK